MTVKSEVRTLTPRQRMGRSVNAVAEMLRKRLSVPNIYIEPGSSYINADVLAVDRAGAGDLHAVQIRLGLGDDFTKPAAPHQMMNAWMRSIRETMNNRRNSLMSLPAHYRYLAIPYDRFSLFVAESPSLYSPDGIGRLGVIAVTEHGEELPVAEVAIAPERFRVDPAKLRNIEKKLLEKVRPDIEVRI